MEDVKSACTNLHTYRMQIRPFERNNSMNV